MRKAYLFLYDDDVGARQEIKGVLNNMQCVSIWRFDIPHSFYITSECSAEKIYEEFVQKNGTKGRFMFIEASTNRQGQMLTDTWYLLTHKKRKPKDS